MSPFVVIALCAQAFLIQAAMSQYCGCGSNAVRSVNLAPVASPVLSSNLGLSSVGASGYGYGGAGTGQVGVVGDVGACGNTAVVGSVPVLGQASFAGTLPATGSVSIAGQCGCGCGCA